MIVLRVGRRDAVLLPSEPGVSADNGGGLRVERRRGGEAAGARGAAVRGRGHVGVHAARVRGAPARLAHRHRAACQPHAMRRPQRTGKRNASSF